MTSSLPKLQTAIELGVTIRSARKSRGWSQTELGDAADISRPSVARIEGGMTVSTETLVKVTEALGLKIGLAAS